ncbi:methyltransferase-like protein 25 [Plakobranchus ocellatus]|uniref:Methyltransferase-like protein 25 n=1 Tax=Plakobranchus ocellatus TaxID=259542 RepID=A0AAV4C814_9GAST|nr:methyltransferase-like protein 25 [Plakobranchus ocellatus]
MSAFFQLKLVLAPVIESLILLDRLAFLLEQENVSSAHLVQLFDPVKSPRCFALIATKRKGQPVCEDSI